MTAPAISPAAATQMSRPLEGRVALVTGGAGGLGSAICRVLGGAGASVCIADVRANEAEAVVRELEGEGCAVATTAADLTNEWECERAIEAVVGGSVGWTSSSTTPGST